MSPATHPAAELARALGEQAERVCRRYLSSGRREGNYWLVGDIDNSPGRSLYVRLVPPSDGRGHAGKWTDAQSGEHGDLLDIVMAATPNRSMADALSEARNLLDGHHGGHDTQRAQPRRASSNRSEAARRLFAMSRAIAGTVAQRYLASRGILLTNPLLALRFHPCCWYRPAVTDRYDVPRQLPALIAEVTDGEHRLVGLHRTWLDPGGCGKAAVAVPRRAMGDLLGHGVRLGVDGPIMVAGEGIETVLSLHMIAPRLPMIAALSAAHLAALHFPSTLRRLYVARERDPAGLAAFDRLAARASAASVELLPLDSTFDDFNDDLRILGVEQLRARVTAQLEVADLAAIG